MLNVLRDKGYLVIDDIISKNQQDKILDNIFNNHKEQPGFLYTKEIVPNYFGFNFSCSEIQTQLSMTLVKQSLEPTVDNTLFKVEPMFISHGYYKIIENISGRLGLDIKPLDIIRSKLNLQFKSVTGNKDHYNIPHVDIAFQKNETPIPYYSLIYYVNNSDAYTYLFDKKIQYGEDYKKIKSDKEIKIIKKVKSKKGRLLIFDGKILHTGSNPINDEFRLILNTVIKY